MAWWWGVGWVAFCWVKERRRRRRKRRRECFYRGRIKRERTSSSIRPPHPPGGDCQAAPTASSQKRSRSFFRVSPQLRDDDATSAITASVERQRKSVRVSQSDRPKRRRACVEKRKSGFFNAPACTPHGAKRLYQAPFRGEAGIFCSFFSLDLVHSSRARRDEQGTRGTRGEKKVPTGE